MKTKDLRALLNRAAAVVEDPSSETAEERAKLAEDLAQAAENLGTLLSSPKPRSEIAENLGPLLAKPKPRSKIDTFRKFLKSDEEHKLLDKMVAHGVGENLVYACELDRYITRGSTLELRELVKPFGDYWKDRDFFNLVNGIDSAHHRFDMTVRHANDFENYEWDTNERMYVPKTQKPSA